MFGASITTQCTLISWAKEACPSFRLAATISWSSPRLLVVKCTSYDDVDLDNSAKVTCLPLLLAVELCAGCSAPRRATCNWVWAKCLECGLRNGLPTSIAWCVWGRYEEGAGSIFCPSTHNTCSWINAISLKPKFKVCSLYMDLYAEM